MIPSRPLSFFEMLHETLRIFSRTFLKGALLNLLLLVPGVVILLFGFTSFIETVGDSLSKNPHLTDAKVTAVRNIVLDSIEERSPGSLGILREFFHAPAHLPRTSELRSADTLSLVATSHDSNALSPKAVSLPSSDTSGATSHPDTSIAAKSTTDHTTADALRNQELEGKVESLATSIFSAPGLISSWFLIGLGYMLTIIVGTGAAVGVIDLACRAFEERSTSLKLVLRSTFRRNLWMVLAYYAVFVLVFGIAPSFLRIPFALHPSVATGILSFIGTMITLFFVFRLIFTVQVLISEELDLVKAVKRSWELTRGQMLRIVGSVLGLAIGIIGAYCILLFFVAALVAGNAMEMVRYLLFADTISIAKATHDVASLMSSALAIYGIPALLLSGLQIVFITVLYYDLRTRNDGPLSYDHSDPLTAPHSISLS